MFNGYSLPPIAPVVQGRSVSEQIKEERPLFCSHERAHRNTTQRIASHLDEVKIWPASVPVATAVVAPLCSSAVLESLIGGRKNSRPDKAPFADRQTKESAPNPRRSLSLHGAFTPPGMDGYRSNNLPGHRASRSTATVLYSNKPSGVP